MALLVDPAIGNQCAGILPFNPTVNSLVLYYSDGHFDHTGKIGELLNTADYIRIRPEIPILCTICKIRYLADQESHDVFAELVLRAVTGNPELPPFEESREDIQPGFFGKDISSTHITRSLHLPDDTFGVFPTPRGDRLRMIDLAGNSWDMKYMNAASKSGYYLTGVWKDVCAEKKIVEGDRVFFKRSEEGICFSFRRQTNQAALRYIDSEKANVNKVVEAVRRSRQNKKFTVKYFPNWVDYLVDPFYLSACNQRLRNGIKIKKRTTKLKGTITEVGVDASVWKNTKVRWDGGGGAVAINSWDVVPA